MKFTDHLASWLLVALMMVGLVVSSYFASPIAHDVACTAIRDHERTIASALLRGTARVGWVRPDALGRFADAGHGVERDDAIEPAWAHEAPNAAAHSRDQSGTVASAASLKPMRMCLSAAGREWRAAARHTPQPLSSHEPPLTI